MCCITSRSSLFLALLNNRSITESMSMIGNNVKTDTIPIRISLSADTASLTRASGSRELL